MTPFAVLSPEQLVELVREAVEPLRRERDPDAVSIR